MMKTLRSRSWLIVLLVVVATAGVAHAAPSAPAPLSPASGASVQIPFAISWTPVSDPAGIVAYNWQVSSSSSFSPVILLDSTSGQTQATVSGLASGTYFWRVQAVNGSFVQGAWSAARSFVVTGTAPGAPGTPALAEPKGYSTFHPYEVMTFSWTAVPGAATYVLQVATDSRFPVATRSQFDNIPAAETSFSFAIANPEGNYWARVFAVDANGVYGMPSNLTAFSVFYDNPLPPPPTLLSPANGTTLTLPVTLSWSHVLNPQPSGYELQIAKDSRFRNIELDEPQLNGPDRTVLSLTPGQKFWRVRSAQGDASPTTAAITAWSSSGTFTISSAPPVPVSVSFTVDPLTSGNTTWVAIQLTSAPPTTTSVALASSNPSVAPVPASILMPANTAWTQFQMQAGQATSPTPATITASLNGKTASRTLTVQPTALKSLTVSPSSITGGAQSWAIVMLSGQAPPGGAIVTLSSDSPAITPPPSVFVDAGSFSVSFPLQTRSVATTTTATVTATWNGVSAAAPVTLLPAVAPAAISLSPTSTVGLGGSSFATVSIDAPQPSDTMFQVTSSNPAAASVPNGMMVPAGTTRGGFNIFTSSVAVDTPVTISVSGGGVTQSATLLVKPSSTSGGSSTGSGTTATLTVTASGRGGETVSSTPSGLRVAVGSTGSASFATGTSITLSVSNGRDAIWSGACSSGGNKTKTCTFTLNANASVAANVQ
jgi:hypothetical protein